MKKYGLIILLFLVAFGLVYLFSSKDNYIKTGKLYISEVVASNSYTLKDSDGEYSDYIEIYNGYNSPINLLGYRLSDSIFEVKKWTFPEIIIEPGEYLIIYASGKNKCNEKTMCHTNFKLKSDGETVSLIDNTGNIINRVTYPKILNDQAYSFIKNDYFITNPTPGKENSEKEIKNVDLSKYKIVINEYLTHNKGSNYINNGGYYDWVELYNQGNDVSLSGLSLSDDEKNLNKFMLPDVVIKKNEYLVIYLTGGINIEGYICANFKLSDNDQKIILSGNGKIIDEAKIVKLDKNVSFGRKGDKWLYFPTPTPGRENKTNGVEGMKNGNS